MDSYIYRHKDYDMGKGVYLRVEQWSKVSTLKGKKEEIWIKGVKINEITIEKKCIYVK